MRDEHQRRAVLAIETKHQLGDLYAGGTIQIAGGLIGHQQFRLTDKRACDRDALLLAAGELPRIMPGAFAESDAIEPCARSRRCVSRVGKLERQHDVFQCRQRRQ